MIEVAPLTDSTSILHDAPALKQRWEDEGVLFFRGVLDPDLIARTEERFRQALAGEALIDPAVDKLVWTGNAPQTRRPCDALGTEVWHEFVKLPLLNDLMRTLFDDEPVWIPIVGHRSSMPSGPIEPGADIFAGRHQDSYFSRGMHYIVCWMPIKDAALDCGSFAVAPGVHKRGNLYTDDHMMRVDGVPDEGWCSADFRAGDLLVFDFYTPHATLPNPSNQIRISLDVRAVAASSPIPVIGAVESVDGADVIVCADDGRVVEVHVTDETYIRDMNPFPRIPTNELTRIAFPGARVMATVNEDGEAVIFRRNFY
jgi:ectoine hydroxylase-related dioxygenase (phytanoyl-CoA dioxygenase family)